VKRSGNASEAAAYRQWHQLERLSAPAMALRVRSVSRESRGESWRSSSSSRDRRLHSSRSISFTHGATRHGSSSAIERMNPLTGGPRSDWQVRGRPLESECEHFPLSVFAPASCRSPRRCSAVRPFPRSPNRRWGRGGWRCRRARGRFRSTNTTASSSAGCSAARWRHDRNYLNTPASR
jgi:hypothetical protein